MNENKPSFNLVVCSGAVVATMEAQIIQSSNSIGGFLDKHS